jgi:hypothetical protein
LQLVRIANGAGQLELFDGGQQNATDGEQ